MTASALKDKLQTDIKNALKSGNAQKRLVLSLILSSVKSRELDKRTKLSKTESDVSKLEGMSQLTDEEVLEVILSEVKKRKESIESYEKGGREELAQKERDELSVLMEYMPEQMTEDEIRSEVRKAIAELGVFGLKDMGKVIGFVMAKVKGKADGQLVSKIVKGELTDYTNQIPGFKPKVPTCDVKNLQHRKSAL